MSGSDARRGFRYQDLYLLSRLLTRVREVLRTVWRTGGNELFAALDASALRFGLEAKPNASPLDQTEAPWDITVSDGAEEEIIEAKSGEIQRHDRLVFWRRLRNAARLRLNHDTILIPALVVDPEAESIGKWRGLADAAAGFTGGVTTAEPNTPVRGSGQLLEEALFSLCAADTQAVIPLPDALTLLRRFRIHEQRGVALQEDVEKQLSALFPDAPEAALAAHLRDWLDQRASAAGEKSKRFGIAAPLREISFVREAIALDRGTWRRWLDLRKEWRAIVQSKATGRLGAGGGTIPIADAQPELAHSFTTGRGSKLVLGPGGAGKTTLLTLIDGDSSRAGESWLVPAANLSESEIDDLAAAVRFGAALVAPDENVRVAVDALDEVEPSVRERWGAVLARLAVHGPVEVIATIRNSDLDRDSRLRSHLESWTRVNLTEWPEELVRRLLVPTGYEPHVNAGLLGLLRTPILLDLFWRTFVEARPSGTGAPRLPMTRHQLLSTFWVERLIRSSRHAALRDKPACFEPIFAAAAHSLGAFKEDGLDAEALGALESEAVLINIGRLRPKWQFRHPLLRDFAFAQWCLASDSSAEVATRWESIEGAIPRQGVLRAIVEAVIDDRAAQDYQNISFDALAEILVVRSDEARSAFIRAVATLPAMPTLDPAAWPKAVRHRLPLDFGAELVGATRREVNLSWAVRFADWSDTAEWLDDSFVIEINSYLRLFLSGRHQATEDASARLEGAQLAVSVRRSSESARFRGAFEWGNRYQKHFAMESIAALLPERETLAWFAREVPHMTWLTQIAILENLRFVAHADPPAAADLYRAVVGLHTAADRWALDEELWGRDISHNAFDLSLTGPNAHESLLSCYPEAFLPVAVAMAEALHWRDEKQRAHDHQTSAYLEAIRGLPPAQPDDAAPDGSPDPLEDLIDDVSRWQFESRSSPCQAAIRDTLEQAAARSIEEAAVRLFPVLRKSRLASVQVKVLETATKHAHISAVQPVLGECLIDQRLFHSPGLLPALQSAITAAWKHLDPRQQELVLANVEATAASRSHYRGPLAGRMLLAALPLDVLDAEQRDEASAYREQEIRRAELETSTEDLPEGFHEWQRDEHGKQAAAEWPTPIDRQKLEELHVHYSALQGPPSVAAKNSAIRAQGLMLELFSSFAVDPHAWDSDSAVWLWHAVRVVLQAVRQPLNARTVDSDALLRAAAELALKRLEAGRTPRKIKGDGERLAVDGAWFGALAVANEALVHPELINAATLVDRFAQSVVSQWNVTSAVEQVDILHHVTFVRHWTRPGPLRAHIEGRLWSSAADGRVLSAALALIPHLQDPERERVLRIALNRAELPNAEKLAQDIGGLLGEYSMVGDERAQCARLIALGGECLSTPYNFPLLVAADAQRAFLSRFAFGMKTQAKHYAAHLELAADFGRRNLAAWHHMHGLPPANDHNTSGIALFAHYWLSNTEEPGHSLAIRLRWWQELKPLRDVIVQEGSARDLSHFYFLFRGGKLLDLCGTGELFDSLDSLLNRMEPLLHRKLISLEQTSFDDPDRRHWREALDHAVHAIEFFRKSGALEPVAEGEAAHRLLSRLTAAPFQNAAAKDVLHRLVS